MTYRVALIGTGAVGGLLAEAVAAAEDRALLMAACDVDAARAAAFAAQYDIPQHYIDVDRMLEKIQPDLVVIGTPPATHAGLAVRCLEAGAWVWCEKPLCASLAEFDAISQAESRTGRYVSTVFQWRFGSAARHLRRLITEEVLGAFRLAVCQTLWFRDESYYRVPWRGRWQTEVGGTTMGHGIHLIDLLLWLVGQDWQEVQAIVGTLDRPIEVENVSLAMVRFASGALASLTTSAISPRQQSYLRLDFQRATVAVSALYSADNSHWRFGIPDGAIDDDLLNRLQPVGEDIPGRHPAQFLALLDAMDRNVRPPISGDDSRRILEFVTSLYKSAFTGAPVRRGTITPADAFYHAMNGRLQGV